MIRRLFSPAVLVGTLSLAAVVGLYWLIALRPGTNAALVPVPPKILAATFARAYDSVPIEFTPTR